MFHVKHLFASVSGPSFDRVDLLVAFGCCRVLRIPFSGGRGYVGYLDRRMVCVLWGVGIESPHSPCLRSLLLGEVPAFCFREIAMKVSEEWASFRLTMTVVRLLLLEALTSEYLLESGDPRWHVGGVCIRDARASHQGGVLEPSANHRADWRTPDAEHFL